MAKPTVAIVGPGSLGSALAVALHRARYRISEVVFPAEGSSGQKARNLARALGAKRVLLTGGPLSADVVWLCVPDSAIGSCAEALAKSGVWKGKVALHPSGALTADELRPLRQMGADAASAHPMMSFVRDSAPDLKNVPFAIEGDRRAVAVARRMVRDLGGKPVAIRPKDKPLYHAWGAFVSPLLIALLATAEKVACAAGVSRTAARKRMMPIIIQTLANYSGRGPEHAFSGPLIRGDVATVRRHLQELADVKNAKPVYVALARAALELLPTCKRKILTKLLSTRSPRKRSR